MKSRNWLGCHRRMFSYYGGVSHVTVPDCYVAVDGDYYSAPHIHRHKRLRIKLTEHHVEIFPNHIVGRCFVCAQLFHRRRRRICRVDARERNLAENSREPYPSTRYVRFLRTR
jgi:hypothetical protein